MTAHDHVEQLIPWYVNGTLNEAEMDRVNRHLSSCSRCTASVEREVCFSRDWRADPPGLERLGPSRAGWTAISARLTRRPLVHSVPTATPAAAAAVCLTLLLAAGAFLLGQHLEQPVYETRTGPVTHDGPMLQIVFEPETPEHVIRGVVLKSGGALIAGPTATGIYRIGLPAGRDRDELVARLREAPAVRWITVEEP